MKKFRQIILLGGIIFSVFFQHLFAAENTAYFTATSPTTNINQIKVPTYSAPISGGFTFETLFYPTANGAGGYGAIWSERNGSQAASFVLQFNNLASTLRFDINGTQRITSSNTVNMNAWNHAAVVVTSTGATLYLNGIATSWAGAISINPGTYNAYLGCDFITSSTYTTRTISGFFDNTRFWTIARTATQLYQNRFTDMPSGTTNLLINYNYNSGDASDASGNGKTAVSYGSGVTFPTYTNGSTLSNITIPTGGIFKPAFNIYTTTYQVLLPNETSSVTPTLAKSDAGATVTGDGVQTISNGIATSTIGVTGSDATNNTYTLNYVNLALKHSYTFGAGTAADSPSNGATAVVGTINGGTVSSGIYTASTSKTSAVGTTGASGGDYIYFTGSSLALNSYPAITTEEFVKAGNGVNNGFNYLQYFGGAATNYLMNSISRTGTQSYCEFQGFSLSGSKKDDGKGHHVVTTLTSDSIYFYIDGSLVGATLNQKPISQLATTYAYLGKSGWTDPTWLGSIGEFNIYSGKMDAATVLSRSNSYLKDANLSAITLSVGSITFDPNVTTYNIDIPLNTTSVTVGATASKDFATMTGTGAITCNPGGATNVVVTSADGTTTKTYTLNFIPPTPVIAVVQSALSFDELNNTGTLTVTGANLSDLISISGPSNFSFNPTTLPANSTTASVTVTYDGLAASSGNITLSSPGATSQTVSLVGASNTLCFTPLYATGNLVTDPYLNSLTAYSSSWGVGTGATINTDLTKVYCGLKSGKVTGTKAGSITYPLTGKWAVNSGYRIRAKVMVDAGTFNFNVSGWSGASADIVNTYTVNAGVWQTVDFKFATGSSLGTNQYFFFNNVTSNTAGTGYIDNIEMYNIPLIIATAATGGTVSGAGPFNIGATVSLVATPYSGYHFVKWTESGSEVSQSATYIFSASTNRTLVANFAANAVSVTSDTNASTLINCGSCDVTVSSGTTFTVDATKIFNSVTVAPGAKLTVASGNILSTALTLQSSGTGTATFVDADPTGSPITAIVQQYLPQGRNWYVGVPFTTASGVGASALTATGTGTTVSYYDEPSSSWVNNYTGILTRGVGYIAVSNPTDGSATNNMSFSGALNTGSVTVPLTRKGATKAGFNLVANPYPSYLNAMAAINANANMENTIWYRTRSASAYYFETVNTTSGVGTNNAGTGTVTGYVPPMQAFWVRTITDNNSITFTNAMRAHAGNITLTDGQTVLPTTLMKAGAVKNTQHQMLRLKVSNGTNSDETVIYTNDNASNNYDAYDSQKMTNNTSIPELFTIADNNNLVINGINCVYPNMEIPLGFFTKESNNFSIKATQISNLDGYTIVLRDNLQQTEQALTDTTTTYSFNSGVTSSVSRFSILFKSGSVTTGVNKPGNHFAISVYKNKNGEIVIDSPLKIQNNSRATLYNSIGQVQEIAELTGSRTVLRKTHPGIYIVSVMANGMNSINKVVIE